MAGPTEVVSAGPGSSLPAEQGVEELALERSVAADEVVVLDYGGQYSQLIARRVRECGVFSELLPHHVGVDEVRRRAPKGLILSGGPASVYAPGAPRLDPELLELGIPVLGICYGMQALVLTLGGRVEGAEVDHEHRAVLGRRLRLENGRVLQLHPASLPTRSDGARRVHRSRAAGQDQPLRVAAADLLDADVVRQQLGEDPALADPAGDQLRVLTAIVEDDDLVGRHPPLERELLDALLGRERGAAALRDELRHRPAITGCGCGCALPRAPIPIAWSRWSDLPSVCSAGATISSARLNSAMSW